MFETEDDQQVRDDLIRHGWQCDSDGDLWTRGTGIWLWNPLSKGALLEGRRTDQNGEWRMSLGNKAIMFPTLRAAYTAWLLGVTP